MQSYSHTHNAHRASHAAFELELQLISGLQLVITIEKHPFNLGQSSLSQLPVPSPFTEERLISMGASLLLSTDFRSVTVKSITRSLLINVTVHFVA